MPSTGTQHRKPRVAHDNGLRPEAGTTTMRSSTPEGARAMRRTIISRIGTVTAAALIAAGGGMVLAGPALADGGIFDNGTADHPAGTPGGGGSASAGDGWTRPPDDAPPSGGLAPVPPQYHAPIAPPLPQPAAPAPAAPQNHAPAPAAPRPAAPAAPRPAVPAAPKPAPAAPRASTTGTSHAATGSSAATGQTGGRSASSAGAPADAPVPAAPAPAESQAPAAAPAPSPTPVPTEQVTIAPSDAATEVPVPRPSATTPAVATTGDDGGFLSWDSVGAHTSLQKGLTGGALGAVLLVIAAGLFTVVYRLARPGRPVPVIDPVVRWVGRRIWGLIRRGVPTHR